MMAGMRFFIMLLMLASLGTYFYLNTDKVGILRFQYNEFVNGERALDVELTSDSESFFHYRLRSSDIFDAEGTRQVSFHSLDPDVYARITGNTEELKLRVDGEDVPFKAIEKANAVQLIWADRKLNIVQSGDMQAIAQNIAYEHSYKHGVYQCYRDGNFCQSVRTSTKGIGPEEGPYLDNEPERLKRGLPRGRWGYGPSSMISVFSKISTEAYIWVYMLRLSENQEVNIEGPILGQQPVAMKKYSAPYGGLQLYPMAVLIRINLQPGSNDIELSYSEWAQPDRHNSHPRAVYITNIRIKGI